MEKFTKFSPDRQSEKSRLEESEAKEARPVAEMPQAEKLKMSEFHPEEGVSKKEESAERPDWSLSEKDLLLAKKVMLIGYDNPEIATEVGDWMAGEESKVEVENTPLATIVFNLKRARFYFEAGFKDEAIENYEDARRQAWNENRMDLYNAIMKEMDEAGV